MRFLMLNWRDPENPLAGGAERVTLGYLSDLVRRGHDVYWFANDFPGAKRTTTIEGVHIIRGGGKGTSILEAWRWYRQQPKFDLVIDQHHGIPWYAPWWCKTNCIAYIHEVLGPIWKAFYKWPTSSIGQLQEIGTHWLYRNVLFWTACESTQIELQKHGVKKVKIIRYGVHTDALFELPSKQMNPPLRLVAVSRLAPNKRIDHAVRTLAELRRRKIEATLTLVGGGDMESQLSNLAKSIGLESSVKLTGPLSEKAKNEVLQQSHLLLHTSQREGWGLNVIEANAMGTPAAVYPVAGLIESTLDNETGVVARAESPEMLAERIIDLVKNPEVYQRLRVNAWNRAKTFHWSKILPEASDWLEEMARSGWKNNPEHLK